MEYIEKTSSWQIDRKTTSPRPMFSCPHYTRRVHSLSSELQINERVHRYGPSWAEVCVSNAGSVYAPIRTCVSLSSTCCHYIRPMNPRPHWSVAPTPRILILSPSALPPRLPAPRNLCPISVFGYLSIPPYVLSPTMQWCPTSSNPTDTTCSNVDHQPLLHPWDSVSSSSLSPPSLLAGSGSCQTLWSTRQGEGADYWGQRRIGILVF